jgi:hypothetical protein
VTTAAATLPGLLTDRGRWLAGLTYAEQSRAHTYEGRPIASVTQILEQAGKTDFSMVKAEVLMRKGLIGTAAHLAAHFYDDGDLVAASVDKAVAPYLDGWILFREERGFAPLCLETVIFSRQHGYTGRLDRLGTVQGLDRLVLLDIKTGDPDAARADLQTFAYELAVEEELAAAGVAHALIERWAVQVFRNGRYRVTRYPTAPRSWRHDRAEFLDALSRAREATGLTWRPAMFSAPPSDTLPDELPPDLPPDEPPPVDDLRDVFGDAMPPEEPPTTEAPPESVSELLPAEPPAENNEATSLAAFVEPVTLEEAERRQAALMEQKRDTVVDEAGRLAKAITDQDSCQAAANYATFIDDALREAHDYYDPLVKRARIPYDDRLEERRKVVEPLEQAKALLVGKTGAVTAWLQEQTRLAQERARAEQQARDEAAAKERARLAAEAQEKAQAAVQAAATGDTAKAHELQKDVAALTTQAMETTAAPVQVEAPKIDGVTGKKSWTAEVTSLKELVLGIARPHIVLEVIQYIKAIPGWETATAPELITALDLLEGKSVDIPVTAVEPNDAYLRTRAKADEGTLSWPGVRFYNAGSSALAPASRRGARKP